MTQPLETGTISGPIRSGICGCLSDRVWRTQGPEHHDAPPFKPQAKEEKMTPQKLADHFGMSPHPEGGFFTETYRSQGSIPADALPGFGGARNFSTGILFLLRRGEYSHLHRLKQDEMWHF